MTILTTSMLHLSRRLSNKNPSFLRLLILRRNPLLPQQRLNPFLPGPARLVCPKFLLHLHLLEFLHRTDVSPSTLMIITCLLLSLKNVLNHQSILIILRVVQILKGGRNRPPDRVALACGVVREADEVGYVYYILIHLTLP